MPSANIERAMCFSQWHITAEATMLPLSRCLTLTLLLSAAAGISGQDPMQQYLRDQTYSGDLPWGPTLGTRPPLPPNNLCTGSKPVIKNADITAEHWNEDGGGFVLT
jgi:hypothetical protein